MQLLAEQTRIEQQLDVKYKLIPSFVQLQPLKESRDGLMVIVNGSTSTLCYRVPRTKAFKTPEINHTILAIWEQPILRIPGPPARGEDLWESVTNELFLSGMPYCLLDVAYGLSAARRPGRDDSL